MTVRYFIILTIFLPTLLFGQSKYCNAVSSINVSTPCYLKTIKKVGDTIITTIPNDCNDVHFDSTASGHWKIYTTDTITLLEIVSIKNGQRNGTEITFYANGQIKSKGEYKNGKLNGDYISFYETQKIYMEGHNQDDKFTGTNSEYWDNGNIAYQQTSKDGSSRWRIDEKYWDKDGNVIDYEKYRKLWYDCNNSVMPQSDLTQDFLQDSTGCTGQREKHILNTEPANILFDGQSILGKTKEELVALLGKPNSKQKILNKGTLEYYITTCGNKYGYSIYIVISNGTVKKTGIRMYCG